VNKKILITGASGYLAQALLPCAVQRAKVVGIARNIDAISSAVHAIAVDLTDHAAVVDVVLSQNPDAIIHCAAVNPGGSDMDMVAVNDAGKFTMQHPILRKNVTLNTHVTLKGGDYFFLPGLSAVKYLMQTLKRKK